MNGNQNTAGAGPADACAGSALPQSAQQVIFDRARELRAQAVRLVEEATGLEMLARSLPGIMPVDAHVALGRLVRSSRF